MEASFLVPRVRRAGGYRSKDPAIKETDRVCSYTFSDRDLQQFTPGAVIELRGSALLSPVRVWDVARSFFGARGR